MQESSPSIQKAFDWLEQENGIDFLLPEEHCPVRDVFQSRANKMVIECSTISSIADKAYLLGLVAGEIGNNSFDHNLGNWRDEKGTYFIFNISERVIVIADRGSGVLCTLRNVRPSIADDCEALTTAFTETLSGRAPENRGNGLKLVAKVVREQKWKLVYCSGRGIYTIDSTIASCTVPEKNIDGMVAVLFF
ncbi:hypothetical protein HY627_02565 [Candidatus Uhrbacteria bacterium]|nr:hypothetical protein [Candidatus Uhrbacteria bacterium]